jgi:hypothetical protein
MFDTAIDKSSIAATAIKQQFSKLDRDLALQVAFSGLSLNQNHVLKTTQVMGYLQMLRFSEDETLSVEERNSLQKYANSLAPRYIDDEPVE